MARSLLLKGRGGSYLSSPQTGTKMAFSLLLPTREGGWPSVSSLKGRWMACSLAKRRGMAFSLLLRRRGRCYFSSPSKGRGMAFSLFLKRKQGGSTFSLEGKERKRASPFSLLSFSWLHFSSLQRKRDGLLPSP